MTRAPTPSESETLQSCGGLLRFATENIKDIPEKTVSTICAAWDAQEAKTWDQKIATEFWLAFNSLCTLIKPVTIDTLSANLRELPPPKWKFWTKAAQQQSLSGRTAERYLFLLMFLLFLAVILGFLASTAGRLSTELEKLIDSNNELAEKIVAETDSLESEIGPKEFTNAGTKSQPAIALIQNQLQRQYYFNDQMLQKADVMSRLMSFGRTGYAYELGTLKAVKSIEEVRDSMVGYYATRRAISDLRLKGTVYIGVISTTILPILLGLMGACAYIIRLISDEIKDTTFSATAPVRHLVRIALGGLAGVVIGFGGVANAGSLSPSALAFIAGYAVEPVFATFDSIAEKFRR